MPDLAPKPPGDSPVDLSGGQAPRQLLEQQLAEQAAVLQETQEHLDASKRALYQSEKMAAIGTLCAGVAHEINNPVGYVASNITTLATYFPEIQAALMAVRALVQAEAPDLSERVDAILTKHDTEELLNDAVDMTSECTDGTNRVLEIVAGLKSFARTDDATMAATDVNDCVRTTLAFVNNELKYKCTVTLDLDDSLPEILGSAGQLNQVFTNLLINAGHAIEDSGEITVRSQRVDQSIQITVTDNGCGIEQKVIDQIFEPFFTTKPEDQGTGLGLAISHSIVEEHGGSIHVESELGAGTSFVINLPLDRPDTVEDIVH